MKASLLTKMVISTMIILVLNASLVSAEIETDQKHRPISQDYFDYYSTTLLDGRDYTVTFTSTIPVDFFILSSTDAKIYEKLVKGTDQSHSFGGLDILYNSYNENITEINLIFNTPKDADVQFIIDNSDVTGINANSSGFTSMKIEYTGDGNAFLPGFQFYLLFTSLAVLIIIRRK